MIEGATSVKVHLDDRDYPAQVKGIDPATDIALLKIDAGHPLRYLELGDSDAIRVGDWVMVIGNPLNLDKTVTTGVVSAKGRSIGISDVSFENFIQTDAAINFGNSGGPLLNMQGQVVAIATAINYGAENIGFAVPVNTLKEILPQLREKGQGQPRLPRHPRPQPRLHAGAGLRARRAPTAPWCVGRARRPRQGGRHPARRRHPGGRRPQGQADPRPHQLRLGQGARTPR